MFCRKCGNELPDKASFCAKCGTPVADAAEPAAEPARELEPLEASAVAVQAQPEEAVAHDGTPRKRKRTSVIIAAVLAVVAVAAVVVVAAVAIPAMNKAGSVELRFDTEAAGVQDGAVMPVHVVGTDAEGNSVNEYATITADSPTITLPEGTYVVEPAGDPVSGDGSIYRTAADQSAQVDVVVANQSLFSKEYEASVNGTSGAAVSFSYTHMPVDKVTAADVEATKAWAAQIGDTSAADAFEKAYSDHYHVSASTFSLDIPEYWRGKVRWEVLEDEPNMAIAGDRKLLSQVKIYAVADAEHGLAEERELATVYSTVGEQNVNTVDLYTAPCDTVEQNNIVTQVAITQWVNGMDLEANGLTYLVDLQTAGAGKVPTGYYAGDKASIQAQKDFYDNELISTIKISVSEEDARELCKAYYHVSTDYYEFDIPEYWWGKVEWNVSTSGKSNLGTTNTETEVYFYDSDSKRHNLLIVESYAIADSKNPDIWVGDYSYIGLKKFEQDNRRTRITVADNGAVVFDKNKNKMATTGDFEAADLVTFGKVKGASDLQGYSEATEVLDFTRSLFETEFLPTFKLK